MAVKCASFRWQPVELILEVGNEMPIWKTAAFRVKPESRARCEAAIREFVDAVRANEPETLHYTSLRQGDGEDTYLHVMAFADERAEERHRSSDWVRQFVAVLYPETVDGVTFTDYQPVAAAT